MKKYLIIGLLLVATCFAENELAYIIVKQAGTSSMHKIRLSYTKKTLSEIPSRDLTTLKTKNLKKVALFEFGLAPEVKVLDDGFTWQKAHYTTIRLSKNKDNGLYYMFPFKDNNSYRMAFFAQSDASAVKMAIWYIKKLELLYFLQVTQGG